MSFKGASLPCPTSGIWAEFDQAYFKCALCKKGGKEETHLSKPKHTSFVMSVSVLLLCSVKLFKDQTPNTVKARSVDWIYAVIGKNKNRSFGKQNSGVLSEQCLSTIVKKIAIMCKYIMVISVCSHSAGLEPPAEKAAVQSK